ncbi:MAG: prolyl oligopeptidase family serine peptidase [Verrucomicrobia bacterium]|nr:prolyl oligopeptidase family serine peptidase [Verrucomicrobiota bacterium]
MRIRPTSIPLTLLAAALGFLGHSLAQDAPFRSREKAEAEQPAKKAPRKKAMAKKEPEKQPLTALDYAQWEQLGGEQLSTNGQWLLYTVQRVDKERTLFLHNTKAGNKKPAASYKYGAQPKFSDDSQWLAVTIGKSPAELKKAKKPDEKTPPPSGATIKLRHLPDGTTTSFENVKSLRFSADSQFSTIELAPKPASSPPKKETPNQAGALLVRNLHDQTDTTFGNVVKHSWSEQGALLAMVVDSPSISNALQLFDPATGVLRVLDTSDEDYALLTWRKDSFDLAALCEMKHAEKEDVSHVLLAWRQLDQPDPAKLLFEHARHKKFPEEMFITAEGVEWSKNGKALYCDLKEWEKKPAGEKPKAEEKPEEESKKEDAPEKEQPEKKSEPKTPEKKTLRESLDADSNVEVWHSKDTLIMPKQKKMAGALKNPNRRAVWWLDSGKFVPLATELTERVHLPRTGSHAVGSDRTPHERTGMFGPDLHDIYLINTKNGKRKRIVEAAKYQLSTSPNGRYILYQHNGHIWSHDAKNGTQRNLTIALGPDFTDQEDDTLAEEKPPYENAAWFADSSRVLLFDRYDIWSVAPDGTDAIKLTNGSKQQIRHRLSQATYHEKDDGLLDPDKPLFVALYGDLTKKSGYGSIALRGGKQKPGSLKVLLWEDKQVASLQRARDADTFLFTRQSYKDSPDLFLAGPTLAKTRRITHNNAFQKNYLWGHSELINYTNANGVKLQGTLTYPADYKPGRKYPMIVYIYEKRSQDLHRYPTPSETHPYNPAVFSAEGYFVFQPDIIYRPQEPGLSAVECVVPAVQEVLKTGMIDKKRVGLVGHSWGAYQTAFIVTQTDLFAAGVAGAPLTDMMSMSVSVYWNSGETNAAIFTQSQGRMNTPFWRDPENYIRNSPIHSLDQLKTPLLIAFGDDDGAVDFDQGVQMYNAARWAAKDDFIMLVYPGENHGLRKEENMVDYHYRILEWFGHYLQKDEPKKWITDGTSYLERQKELEDKKEKKTEKPAPKQP